MLVFVFMIYGGSGHCLEITGQVRDIKTFPGSVQIEASDMELYSLGVGNNSLFKQYIEQAAQKRIPVTFYYDPYQWGPKSHHTCFRINRMIAKSVGEYWVEGDRGYWKKAGAGDVVNTADMGPVQPDIPAGRPEPARNAEHWSKVDISPIGIFEWPESPAVFPDEWPLHIKYGIPPDNVVTITLKRYDRQKLRKRIREELAEKYQVYAFGRGLDQMVGRAEKQYDLVYPEFNLPQWWVALKIPKYFTRFDIDFKMRVSKKKLKLFVYHKNDPQDVLLLETSVALGGSGYDHAQGRRRGFGTPSGKFYLKRVINYPYWFPPGWAKQTSPSKPGRRNPYGIWMSELSRDDQPGSYSFAVAKDTNVRIHSTNRPDSIGKYASHGCIRVHPDVADELFPALLRYISHQKGKKNNRGTIYPLNRTVPVKIVNK